MTRPDAQTTPAVAAGDLEGADDFALVDAFVSGRSEAFDLLVARHRRSVYQLCYRFVHNHEDASDLAQDIFVRVFRGLATFKRDAAFTTWLYRIGVNVCLNRVAVKRPPTEPLDAAAHVDRREPDALELVVRAERADELRTAIAQLPPKQQATLVLRVYQELTHEEIAQILGSTVGAVKTNFFHALGNLRRILQAS
jgi:RNA polymerase sigma-70 factor (ECF subfamily)